MSDTKKPVVMPEGEGRILNVIGNIVTLKLSRNHSNGDAYVFEAVTPPGVGVPPHIHQHEDEMIEVLEGQYEFFIDGKTYNVHKGAFVYFPRFKPHAFRNIGTSNGKTLWVIQPGERFENFFEELGALPATQPPDMKKVGEIFSKYDIEII